MEEGCGECEKQSRCVTERVDEIDESGDEASARRGGLAKPE